MLTSLLKVEAGTQPDRTTAVEPTFRFMGITSFEITPGKESKQIEDEITGSLSPASKGYVNKIVPMVKLGGYVCIEMFPYILEMLNTQALAFPYYQGGAEIGFTRRYDGPTTAEPDPRYMTFVYGEAGGLIWTVTGLILTKLTIKLENEGPWTFEAEGFAYLVEKDGAFASPALPETDYTLCGQSDTTVLMSEWATPNTYTTMACDIVSVELSIETGREPTQRVGSLMPCGTAQPRWKGSIKLTAEVNDDTTDWLQYQLDNTENLEQRVFQVKWYQNLGPNPTDDLIHQVYAVMPTMALQTPTLIGEDQGLAVFEWEGVLHFNPTLGEYLQLFVTNDTEDLV